MMNIYALFLGSLLLGALGTTHFDNNITSTPMEPVEITSVSYENSSDNVSNQNIKNEMVYFDDTWEYAPYTVIHNDGAMLYRATNNRKNIVVAVDAGHGTKGAAGKKIYCHPDKSKKLVGGSEDAGIKKVNAQSVGMVFNDGDTENAVTLKIALILKDKLLNDGYDVLMLRESESVELDLLSRTIMANNKADCHVSLHFDGDGLSKDKGAFFISVPDGLKKMAPVDRMWKADDRLGQCIIDGLKANNIKIYGKGRVGIDLLQTAYSTVPSVDIELGNQCSKKNSARLNAMADGILYGIEYYYGKVF